MSNLSSQFLLPMMELRNRSQGEETIFAPEYVNTYLAMEGYDCPMGKCFFVHYDSNVSSTLDAQLRSKGTFKEKLDVDGDVVYVFTVPEEKYNYIVKPFMKGQYSLIDREYVSAKFPLDPSSATYPNRLILDRSDNFRTYWYEKLGVELPEGAEVWSKMKEENETLRTNKKESIEYAE